MDITEIKFTDKGQKFTLVLKKGKWNLINEETQVVEARFELTNEGYRRDAIRLFEIIHGYIPSYGDLVSYLALLGTLASDERYAR